MWKRLSMVCISTACLVLSFAQIVLTLDGRRCSDLYGFCVVFLEKVLSTYFHSTSGYLPRRINEYMAQNRPVLALRGIMSNQGKFTKKRSRKTNVFLYIPVLISHLVSKHVQQAEKSLF